MMTEEQHKQQEVDDGVHEQYITMFAGSQLKAFNLTLLKTVKYSYRIKHSN